MISSVNQGIDNNKHPQNHDQHQIKNKQNLQSDKSNFSNILKTQVFSFSI